MHIPDLIDNAITPLLYCRDPPVVYAAAMAICRVACKVHKRKDWVESAVYVRVYFFFYLFLPCVFLLRSAALDRVAAVGAPELPAALSVAV